jgi:hypothetical protein
MPWVRLDDHAPEHPKMLRAGPVACWLWVCGLAYCSRHLTDGEVPAEAVTALGVPKAMDAVSRLLREGLWEEAPTGYRIHDYHTYQPSKEQVITRRKRTTDRVTEWKRKHGYACDNTAGNAVTKDVTNTVDNAVGTPPPDPVPDPDPVPVPQEPTVCVPPAPSKPLGYKPRIDVAWPGRPPVPGSLHAEFRDKLGGDPNEADTKLRAWYPIAAAAYDNQPIGDDDFTFWRARFREWIGTTVKPVRASAARLPRFRDEDWCQHDPQCDSDEKHQLMLIRDREG